MPNLVALIDSHFAQMIQYYRTFSCDETWSGHIEIQPRDVIPFAYGSVEALFTQIRDQLRNGRSEFLIGTHGAPDQLPYSIVPGTDVGADSELLDLLGQAANGANAARDSLLDWTDEKKKPVFSKAAVLDKLIGIVQEIQKNRINHLEIRGCNLGSGTGLKALHSCLNSKHTVAPKVTFFSGAFPTAHIATATQGHLASEIDKLGQPKRIYTRSDCYLDSDQSGDDPVAFAMQWSETSLRPHRFAGNIRALNREAVMGWTHAALENSFYNVVGRTPPGGGLRAGGILPIIGMWSTNERKPFTFPGDGVDYLNLLAVENTP